MDKKEKIDKFCNEIYQMAEDNDFTSWDFYIALQDTIQAVVNSMRKHHFGTDYHSLGTEKWKAEYGRT